MSSLRGRSRSQVPSLNGTFYPEEQQLADTVAGWWKSFAATGVPHVAGAPAWPKINGSHRLAMHISMDPYVENGGVALCAGFWDDIGYKF